MSDSFLQSQLAGQQMLNTQLQNRINEYIRTVGTLEQSRNWLQNENNRLQQELAKSKGQSLPPRSNSITQPSDEQQRIESLQKQINELQFTLADWMLSQKAFKELAIQLGQEADLTFQQVIDKAQPIKMRVLDNAHEAEHGTNANGIPLLEKLSDRLREKLKEGKK